MAIEIPLTPNQTSLTRFLSHIQNASVPPKVNGPYLKSVGFKSGNDSYLVPVFKKLGFLNVDGTPTDEWRSFRDKTKAPHVLANSIRRAYGGLFDIYSDAHRKDDEALRNWMRSVTEYDDTKVAHCLATFKTLVSHANFSDVADKQQAAGGGEQAGNRATPDTTIPLAGGQQSGTQNGPASPTVNINIELHLPSSTDTDSYDRFFAAMKKHLFPDAKS